ncbi:hypothetical protein [Streptomyces sp. AVP053U2]|uniref:hypothetical protein n=1 Tax=Streptomyces sp. AVP053U2 TaxID=1737066 RepID=UPI0005AB6F93|nr:hypothetical protein [Streptomyces sp. AVP053U2]
MVVVGAKVPGANGAPGRGRAARCCGYPLPADSGPAGKEGEGGGFEVGGGDAGAEVGSLPPAVVGGGAVVGELLPGAPVSAPVVTGGLTGGWEVLVAELVAGGVGVGTAGGDVGPVAGGGR